MIIQYFILIVGIPLITADCDACIENVCFKKTKLSIEADFIMPKQLAIDRNTNTLFVSIRHYCFWKITIAVSIDTGSTKLMPGLDGICWARAINQETRDYYYGCPKTGLHKYNLISHSTEQLGLNVANVSNMFYSNDKKLYYSENSRGLCYYADKSQAVCYNNLNQTEIDTFVVDKSGDIYFKDKANKHYRQRSSTNKLEHLFTDKFAKPYLDRDSNLYYISLDKIMKWDHVKDNVVNIGKVFNTTVFEAAFDRDNNLVYYNIKGEYALYKIMPDGNTCYLENAEEQEIPRGPIY